MSVSTVKIPLLGLNSNDDLCAIEATAVTGFENVAKEECNQKLDAQPLTSRGRVLFDIPIDRVRKVLDLRSVDNVFVVIYNNMTFDFSTDKEESLVKLQSIVDSCLWDKGLNVWQKMNNVPSAQALTSDLKFRVTCHRVGSGHSFGSPDAAGHFGSAIQEKFRWKVDMTKFDLEVILNIIDHQVYVAIALTKESLHHRNISVFGCTTLRSTIAYSLLLMANIRCGDVVCDPLCGSGAIPIEGAVAFHHAHFLCGDIYPAAIKITHQNLIHFNEKETEHNRSPLAIDIFMWNAAQLPLMDNSVDVFITDLPFGKRTGSKFENSTFYPKLLEELGRASRTVGGRAVLLTQDRRSIIRALQKTCKIWRTVKQLTVNIGGLAAGVYSLERREVQLPQKHDE